MHNLPTFQVKRWSLSELLIVVENPAIYILIKLNHLHFSYLFLAAHLSSKATVTTTRQRDVQNTLFCVLDYRRLLASSHRRDVLVVVSSTQTCTYQSSFGWLCLHWILRIGKYWHPMESFMSWGIQIVWIGTCFSLWESSRADSHHKERLGTFFYLTLSEFIQNVAQDNVRPTQKRQQKSVKNSRTYSPRYWGRDRSVTFRHRIHYLSDNFSMSFYLIIPLTVGLICISLHVIKRESCIIYVLGSTQEHDSKNWRRKNWFKHV